MVFGNGGGNFRRLYAGFLDWVRERDADSVPAAAPALARQAADQWTALAHTLWSIADGAPRWNDAARQAGEIVGVEQKLFESLAQARGGASP